jgi:predicted N-acetyltransferase YhbS
MRGRRFGRLPEGVERVVTIRTERSTDIAAREDILDSAYGTERFIKPSAKLRAGRLPADGLALVALERGRVVGTVRLWNVDAGPGRPALLLGPLAVACDAQGRGIGAKLVRRALRDARRRGHEAVLLVGDAGYYGRFGFSAEKTGRLRMPGPYAPERLLAVELARGALDGASGLLTATGEKVRADLPAFIVAPTYTRGALARAA